MSARHRVVIVGGGFGGLNAAQALRHADAELTLLDCRNFHLFQPLLYQVATGALSPANIAAPLRGILRRQRNVTVLLAEAVDIDLDARRLLLSDGVLDYDTLVLAAGARNQYFGHRDWANLAPGLKGIEDATEIRRRILTAFEAAERATSQQEADPWLTFVIIGAGPTGVELAGALREIALHTLHRDFRRIHAESARVVLLEGAQRILGAYPPDLSEKAQRSLEQLGVEVRCGTMVTDIDAEGLRVRRGEREERIAARTVLWSAGIEASGLGATLAKAAGAETDRGGRVIVDDFLNVPGHREVFVIGDMAHARGADAAPLPGIAPVAIQEGRYVAHAIRQRLAGREPEPFRYRNKGLMATIGRSRAVAAIGNFHFSGTLAWLTWLFVHLLYIVSFQNRLLVLLQWAWNYATFSRSARLITGDPVCPYRNDQCPRKRPEPPRAGTR